MIGVKKRREIVLKSVARIWRGDKLHFDSTSEQVSGSGLRRRVVNVCIVPDVRMCESEDSGKMESSLRGGLTRPFCVPHRQMHFMVVWNEHSSELAGWHIYPALLLAFSTPLWRRNSSSK